MTDGRMTDGQINGLSGLVLCLCLLLPLPTAQKPASSSRSAPVDVNKLTALKVTGTTRYTDKEILAATGLEFGQNSADGDFKEAVQLLGNSGMFSNVAYSFSSKGGAGVKLELQLEDIDKSKLVPAHFENFVWFTDNELLESLQSRVPLFKGLLPLGGNLSDHVSEALQAILTEKHLPGRVQCLGEAHDQNGGPLIGVACRVEEVSILIHGFEFPGATPEQSALLTTAARRAIGGNYARSNLAAVTKFDLLPVYLKLGYLKTEFGPSDARLFAQPAAQPVAQPAPQPAPAPDAQGSADIQVDAILPVTPGKVYSASGVDWKGNSAIPTSELAPLLHLPVGQPADAVRLLADVAGVDKLYRSRGYMAVQIKPEAHFDDEKGTVLYDVNIVEGDLYLMGELDIEGLDTQAKARMMDAWTLRQGQPYNADYLKKYLNDTGRLLPRGVRWATTIHETPDAKDKTVDVEIHFKQQ
jgi:outer membrane protein assembly factor BamA